MIESEFLRRALSDLSSVWQQGNADTLATLSVPDSFLGRRSGLLKGDINQQWARWFVESVVDPRRVYEEGIQYPFLFEEVRDAIVERFGPPEKTQPEIQALAQIVARIAFSIANSMSSARARTNLDYIRRKMLLGISGSPPRCWICGAEFQEGAIESFLTRAPAKLSLPPFVDFLKPRGLSDRDLRIEVDHVVPFSKGGGDEENLELACGWCNRHKSAYLSIYDVEGQPRTAKSNTLSIHTLPQPFWIVRLLALRRNCEHPQGCAHSVENAELTIVTTRTGGAINPANLRVTCYEHDPLRLKRLQVPSVVRGMWGLDVKEG